MRVEIPMFLAFCSMEVVHIELSEEGLRVGMFEVEWENDLLKTSEVGKPEGSSIGVPTYVLGILFVLKLFQNYA